MIDTSQPLKNLEGEALMIDETTEHSLGKAIANILIREQQADPVRAFVLAQSYYKGEEIKKSDLDFVKTAVKATKLYAPIVSGQVLYILENTKEA